MIEQYWLERFYSNPEYSRKDYLVFVYGTLKKGFGNTHVTDNEEFIMYSKTDPIFEMISLGSFPAIIPDGKFHISGEVYRISGKTLLSMDMIEDEGFFYNRTLISVQNLDSLVWAYILPKSQRYDTPSYCPNLLTNNTTKTQTWIKS